MGCLLWYRKINDDDKTRDEINEQSENFKQIQDATSTPISGHDFYKVRVKDI